MNPAGILIAIVGIIVVMAVGAACHDIVVNATKDLIEPLRTMMRLPFEIDYELFKLFVPFLK